MPRGVKKVKDEAPKPDAEWTGLVDATVEAEREARDEAVERAANVEAAAKQAKKEKRVEVTLLKKHVPKDAEPRKDAEGNPIPGSYDVIPAGETVSLLPEEAARLLKARLAEPTDNTFG